MVLEVAAMVAAMMMCFVLRVAALMRAAMLTAFTVVMSTSGRGRREEGNRCRNGSTQENRCEGSQPVRRHFAPPWLRRTASSMSVRAHQVASPFLRYVCEIAHPRHRVTSDFGYTLLCVFKDWASAAAFGTSARPFRVRPIDERAPNSIRMLAR